MSDGLKDMHSENRIPYFKYRHITQSDKINDLQLILSTFDLSVDFISNFDSGWLCNAQFKLTFRCKNSCVSRNDVYETYLQLNALEYTYTLSRRVTQFRKRVIRSSLLLIKLSFNACCSDDKSTSRNTQVIVDSVCKADCYNDVYMLATTIYLRV